MTENDSPQNPPPSPGDATTPTPPAPPPKKKKHRLLWLKIAVALVVLLILLVLLLPTIAGTGIVRSIVVGKINGQLNGKLEIADWSFGWTSGARVDGVKLVDADGRQLLQLDHLDVPVSLIGVMRGKYDLGKVVVDGLDFDARREADGRLNFSSLTASHGNPPAEAPAAPSATPPTPSTPAPSAAPGNKPETKLPNVTGEIVLTNCRGTVEDVQNKTTLHLTSLEADLKIPDINQPIEDSLDVAVDNGVGQSGKLSAKGHALLVKNNVLLTDPAQILREASVSQNITLSGFDLASLTPLLAPGGGIDKLAGTADGSVGLLIAPDKDAALNALLRISQLKAAGRALKGDTLAADTFEVSAQHVGFALDKNAANFDSARITTGPADGSAPIAITLAQEGGSKSSITLFADISSAALSRLAKNLAPGETGTIKAGANIDFAHLAASMPHLFDLQPGLALTSGNLLEALRIDLTPDKSTISQILQLTNIAGRNANTQTAIALQPVELTAQTTNLGGGGLMPDLRDLKLNLASGFATATATATSIGDLRAELHATLQDAQHELSQIFDFGATKFAGNIDVSITSQGNLLPTTPASGPDRTGTFGVHGTVKDLHIVGIGSGPVDEPLIQFATTGNLHGTAQKTIDQLSKLDVTSQIGDSQNPTLDAHFTADLGFHDSAISVQTAVVQKFNLDLALAQQQLGPLIPALSGVHISAGAVIVGGFAKGDGVKSHGLFQAYVQNVDMQRVATAGAAPATLLQGYTLHGVLEASLTSNPAGSALDLTKVEATDNQNLIAVKNTDAQLRFTRGGSLTDMIQKAEASISLPNLGKLVPVLQAMSPPKKSPGAAKPSATVTAGSAVLLLSTSHQNDELVVVPQLTVSPDFAVQNGSVSQTVGPIDFTTTIGLTSQLMQIRQLEISRLSAHGLGAEISLKEPLKISDLSQLSQLIPSSAPTDVRTDGAPALTAGLLVTGDIAPIAHLLETLDGVAPGSEYPYTGAFKLDQNLSGSNGNIALQGSGDVTNFALHNGQAVDFSEADIHLGDDLTLGSNGQELNIGGITLAMTSSNALNLSLKGDVRGLSTTRELRDMNADLTYDAAPLWKIVLPLLSSSTQAQFKDAVVSGKFTKHFVVSGSYPAGVPVNEAMKNLSASGGIALGAFKGHGVDLQNLIVPIFLKNGKLVIANSDKPNDYAAPASMNGGQLSLAGLSVDLADPHMTLSMNPNSQVMSKVGLNPALSDLLGKDVGNILFVGTSDSTGLLNVTVEKCDNVPLDDTLKKNVPSNTGQLAMDISIQDLTLGGGQLGGTLGKLGPALQAIGIGGSQGISAGSLKGSVKDYKLTLAHGTTTHDMTITLGEHERSLRLHGGVDLLSEKLENMTLVLPLSLLGGKDSDLPNGLNIVFKGTVSSPKPDIAGAVKNSLVGNGKPQDILNNLFGGKKKQSD